MLGQVIEIRQAVATDDAELLRIDLATRTPDVTPAPEPPDGQPFFTERVQPKDVLVAMHDGAIAAWAGLGQVIPLPSHQHVLEIRGFAVDPAVHRQGVGRALIEGTLAEAWRRGARKVSLRVLSSNAGGRKFYESCGFVVEGVLRDEFLLDGRYVDDVLMARFLR